MFGTLLAIALIAGILGVVVWISLWLSRRADQKAYEALRQSQETSVIRCTRDRYLTPAEAGKYNAIREQIEQEKPEINAHIQEQMDRNRFSL